MFSLIITLILLFIFYLIKGVIPLKDKEGKKVLSIITCLLGGIVILLNMEFEPFPALIVLYTTFSIIEYYKRTKSDYKNSKKQYFSQIYISNDEANILYRFPRFIPFFIVNLISLINSRELIGFFEHIVIKIRDKDNEVEISI
ncbi:MAG: hypothetical protein CR982_01020 [Candidatus Cloacimonadota bacterium]|nr:MAG: hypothetical protein CR982_01020 [Candidatus Cloacimonadota bacterium]PIE77759.1 MAG: hypothetical protein CSA15_11230 [Candidatus Delongbacteria bacterium]